MFMNTVKSILAGAAALASVAGAAPALAQDVPNLLVMIEDSDRDTIPRDSRVQRNILAGMNDRLISRGYNMFDEQALGIDGYKVTQASDRVRRTDQELIVVARTVERPTIDIVVVYETFASLDKLDFATMAKIRIAGRLLDVHSGARRGNFEVRAPSTYKLPLNCPRECLLEELAEEGRELGIELADVLADKLDRFFVRTGGAATQPAGPATGGGSMAGSGSMGGTVAAGGAPGFERTFYLTFRECSREARMVFEPYLMVFEGYITHRATKCGGTRCDVEYKSSISPDKLRRNLEKMLWHSNNNGRIGVDGMEYRVTCVPQRKTHPTQLDPAEW